ncbi:MAG: type II toxin-antitoxin system HicB family antitoxin [Acidobacteria bacterium]|nr:type II toxin-antitoxin system HicB family antitoxin [Acidobacteriota bacterium]MBV9068066.1 type II toxin-antitoxin system HicB family antitoxin [Acidobacteriota bacterium]MBV9185083.1 type II toxin-antitoxin system HicB family antitoxin [Acidobacteriota bacterium]
MTTSEPTITFTAVFQEAEEGGYIAFIEELPGANTQGETLDEARENLRDAVEVILESNRRRTLERVGSARVIRETMEIRKS